jgi:hypothetical protein
MLKYIMSIVPASRQCDNCSQIDRNVSALKSIVSVAGDHFSDDGTPVDLRDG